MKKKNEPTKPPKNTKNHTIRMSYHHFFPQAFKHSAINVAPNNAISIPITPKIHTGSVKIKIKSFSTKGDCLKYYIYNRKINYHSLIVS